MIRAVLFDLDGTLLDRDAASERWFRSVLARRTDLFVADQREQTLARFLDLDAHGYNDRAQFCRDVLAEFPGLSESPAIFWHEFTTGLAANVQLESPVRALLDRLCARMPVAILTNGSRRTQRAKLAAAQLEHLTTFISEEIGLEKPDSAAFRHALGQMGIEDPSEVLFVGDDPVRDIQGAHGAGLRTCWVSRGRTWSLEATSPEWTVRHVSELESFEELHG
ncbi:MAG: HAD family hydrolase [Myxococcales bacterium]